MNLNITYYFLLSILISFIYSKNNSTNINNNNLNKQSITNTIQSSIINNEIPSTTLDPSKIATTHLPTGLNNVDITDSVREDTCQNQQSFCDNVCGELKSFAIVNECELKTLSWRCYCDNGVEPNAKNYTFPAEFAACTESLRACQMKCGSNSACSLGCANVRNCTTKDKNDGKNKSSKVALTTSKQPSLFSKADNNQYKLYSQFIWGGFMILAYFMY